MKKHQSQLLWRCVILISIAIGAPSVQGMEYIPLPSGTLNSALARDSDKLGQGPVVISAFSMRETPVTQKEFAQFTATHPQWQRRKIPRTFADASYLKNSENAKPNSAVVYVSWFAAQAYCESEHARLPTWVEWEYVAAADSTRRDARNDPSWLQRILGWYAQPASKALPAVGGEANVFGIRDIHGMVWEWVDDFNALLVDGDSRSGDDPEKLKFCGAGAINFQDRMNYAVLMRIALLSSLSADASTGSLGFRCVKDLP
ncbi:MAG: hypothetical protein RLZZ521_375 [Pseudomonadota bacterium]